MFDADVTEVESDPLSYESLLPYYWDLRERNGDMVGWLRIPGTRISYPVMQTKENPNYYLDRDFNKGYSASGSLFVSSICDVDLPTDVVTIYGHRMKTGAMFGSLGDFLDTDFFSEHQLIIFDSFSARNVYRIYSVFSETVGTGNEFTYYDYSMFDDTVMFDVFTNQVTGLAQIKDSAFAPTYGDKILLMSTCEYSHENGRLIIVAVISN